MAISESKTNREDLQNQMSGSENGTAIHDIYSALVADAPRNEAIVEDVRQALLNVRSPLVLTSRTEHLDHLTGRLHGMCQRAFAFKRRHGSEAKK